MGRRPGWRTMSGIGGSERCRTSPNAWAAGGCRAPRVAPRAGCPSRPGPGGWTATVYYTTRPRCSCAASPATGRRAPATGKRTTLTTGGVVVTVQDRTCRLLTLDDQSDLVLRDPVGGRVLALAARNATLKGTSTGGFSASDVSQLIVGQAGAAVTVARATNVPYQNNVTGSTTTPSLVLVKFHDRLSARGDHAGRHQTRLCLAAPPLGGCA